MDKWCDPFSLAASVKNDFTPQFFAFQYTWKIALVISLDNKKSNTQHKSDLQKQ